MENKDIKSETYRPEDIGRYHKQLKHEPVYGPINSRRLGLSLGINPIQGGFACNWSCVYCQYGLDDLAETMKESKRIRFTELSEVRRALEKRLQSSEHYDSVTICGPTEPTLHPNFNGIVDLTIEMRDKYRADIPTSLFTNSFNLINLNLQPLDYVFMKLDAGNEDTFRKFNRAKGTTLDEVLRQIKEADVKRKIIQTMLCLGEDGNFDSKNISDYIDLLKTIKPEEVHFYSILYAPFPNVDVYSVGREEMNELASHIQSITGSKALVFMNPVSEGESFRF